MNVTYGRIISHVLMATVTKTFSQNYWPVLLKIQNSHYSTNIEHVQCKIF
jgi:hypothetical protein